MPVLIESAKRITIQFPFSVKTIAVFVGIDIKWCRERSVRNEAENRKRWQINDSIIACNALSDSKLKIGISWFVLRCHILWFHQSQNEK